MGPTKGTWECQDVIHGDEGRNTHRRDREKLHGPVAMNLPVRRPLLGNPRSAPGAFLCASARIAPTRRGRGILTELKKQVERQNLADGVHVYTATCLNNCTRAPVMQVFPEGTIYCNILPRDVRTIVNEHLEKGRAVDHFTHDPFASVRWNDEIDS